MYTHAHTESSARKVSLILSGFCRVLVCPDPVVPGLALSTHRREDGEGCSGPWQPLGPSMQGHGQPYTGGGKEAVEKHEGCVPTGFSH